MHSSPQLQDWFELFSWEWQASSMPLFGSVVAQQKSVIYLQRAGGLGAAACCAHLELSQALGARAKLGRALGLVLARCCEVPAKMEQQPAVLSAHFAQV